MDRRIYVPPTRIAYLTAVEEQSTADLCVIGQAEKAATRILTELLKKYDRNLVPKLMGVEVDLELLIQMISEINEIKSSFKMDIMLSQIWHDPGLDFQVSNYLIAILAVEEGTMGRYALTKRHFDRTKMCRVLAKDLFAGCGCTYTQREI